MVTYDYSLCTAPYARGTCAVNSNAGYNCSCRVGVMIKDHCADLLTVDIGGYPPANLTWVVDDVMATNDSQAVLTLLPNGSVSDMTFTIYRHKVVVESVL